MRVPIDPDTRREIIQTGLALIRPTIAKVLVTMFVGWGLSLIVPPVWLEVMNLLFKKFEFTQDLQIPVNLNDPLIGGIFIALGIAIYFYETKVQTERLKITSVSAQEIAGKIAQKSSSTVVDQLKSVGFTASHLQDEKINLLLNEIRLMRVFPSYPRVEKAVILANSIVEGELSGGSPTVRAKALALLSRYVASPEHIVNSKNYVEYSKKILTTEEAVIAEAFIAVVDSNDVNDASQLLKNKKPLNYSAFFMIKVMSESAEAALSWFDSARLSISDLDEDGQTSYISALLNTENWDRALEVANYLEANKLATTPGMAQNCAFVYLTNAIGVKELRKDVLRGIPFALSTYPLSDDDECLLLRQRSIQSFENCVELCKNFNYRDVTTYSEQFALWLKLRSTNLTETAKEQLRSYFVTYDQKSLEYLPLAHAFGIPFDIELVEQELDRQVALNSMDDIALGIVRVVLLHTQETPALLVEYLNVHRKQLEAVNPNYIQHLEIEALAKAGLVDDAERKLKDLESKGSESDLNAIKILKTEIGRVKGIEPIAQAIEQFNESGDINDLVILVGSLSGSPYKDKFYEYSLKLFTRTQQVLDALRVCAALSALERFSELHSFIENNLSKISVSDELRFQYAWSLFRQGKLSEVREQLFTLIEKNGLLPSYEALDTNVMLFSGDWHALNLIIEQNWANKKNLTPDKLCQIATIAKTLSPSRAKEILEFSTKKFPANQQVLATSYITATSLGIEAHSEAGEWLQDAIKLSDENGPFRSVSFDDIKEILIEERARSEQTYKVYMDGEAPVSTIAQVLGRTISDFYLIQPLINKNENDIRKMGLIAPFPQLKDPLLIKEKVVAVDTTTALVISSLGLADKLMCVFEKIVIPHSFMAWLFEEKQKVEFHQPSRVAQAIKIEQLVSSGKLSLFAPSSHPTPELAINIGEEFAEMLMEANSSSEENAQHLVISPFPVYKAGDGNRTEEIDLSSYKNNLASSTQLVKKLKSLAVITDAESRKAIATLSKYEKSWPNLPEIKDGATLYLTELSISYLMNVDMLYKVCDAGFKVLIHNTENEEYLALINQDSIKKQANVILESTRKYFFEGLENGKVILAPIAAEDTTVSRRERKLSQAAAELLQAMDVADAALSDDRCINRAGIATLENKSVPVYSTLDFIETLAENGYINTHEKYDFRSTLRESGFAFVAISPDELSHLIESADLLGEEIRPSKQLKEFKDNLLLVKISGFVKLPRDATWLYQLRRILIDELHRQWTLDLPLKLCVARSNWLVELLDLRSWAQCHEVRDDGGIVYLGHALSASQLLALPNTLNGLQKKLFLEWAEKSLIDPLKANDPSSYKGLLESIKSEGKRIYDGSLNLSEDEISEES